MWLNHWKLRWTKIGNKDCPGKVGFDPRNLRMGARAQGLLAESKTFSFNVKRARLLLSILQAFHLLRRHNRESFFVCVYWSRALKNFEWLQALRSRLKVFALLSQSRLSFRKRCWLREGEGLKGRGGEDIVDHGECRAKGWWDGKGEEVMVGAITFESP